MTSSRRFSPRCGCGRAATLAALRQRRKPSDISELTGSAAAGNQAVRLIFGQHFEPRHPPVRPMGINGGRAMYNFTRVKTAAAVAAFVAASAISTTAASANPFNPFEALFGPHREPVTAPAYANPQEDATDPRSELRRQVVDYRTSEAPGTIIIDTPNTYLYLVMGGGKAMRYGIGVGREGFTWSGVKTVERKAEWPDWTPPPEM